MKKKILTILAAVCVFSLGLSACGSKPASVPEDSVISGDISKDDKASRDSSAKAPDESEPEEPYSEEDIDESKQFEEDLSYIESLDGRTPESSRSETGDGNIDESLPEYLRGDGEWIETDGQTTAGEGTNVLAGEEVTLKTYAELCDIGKAVTVTNPYGTYTLKIDSIGLTDTRREGDSENRQVVRVVYTFTNTDYSGDLYIGDVFFKLLGKDSRACATYSFEDVPTSTHPQAVPAAKNESRTVELGYVLTEPSERVTLVFDDLSDPQNGDELYWVEKL